MRRPILLVSLIALSSSLPALAQTAPDVAADQTTPPTTSEAANPRDGDDFHTANDDLVVTAPFVRNLDLFGTIAVVDGDRLARDMRGQIGETLASQPGVSATSFAPGASRPVLRGFQGERVRVLVDGIGSIDASNTSADHAVAFDSLTAERVEILHGPASLLFGSSAIGGAVNIFDRRIPRAVPEAPAHLDALATYGSAANERSGAASIDVPLSDQVAFHVDGGYSRTDDLEIGGYQSTSALRAAGLALAAQQRLAGDTDLADETQAAANRYGVLGNSATRTYSLGSGIALVNDGGSLGVSIGYFDSTYGVPAFPGGEEAVSIALNQWRADLRGEVQMNGSLFDKLRIRAAFADYTHSELDGPDVGTVFYSQGIEGRAELIQTKRGRWSGATGVQYIFRDLNAVGDEAFIPQNDTQQLALFTLQEFGLGPLDVELSGRFERSSVRSQAVAVDRRFNAFSGAAGLSYAFAPGSKIGVNLSRTSRAPSAEELLSDGPHVATQSYELGDPGFGQERSWNLENYVQYRSGPLEASVTGFYSWFDGFIYSVDTGLIEDDLPVFAYRQGKARYYGFEAQARLNVGAVGPYGIAIDGAADYVRARLANGGGDLPRIPALRIRGGVELASDTASLRGEVEWTADQNRTAANETATPGFTLVNLSAQWKPLGSDGGVTLILSGNNIFDVIGRRHASFTKDFVPISGRDIRLTARLSF